MEKYMKPEVEILEIANLAITTSGCDTETLEQGIGHLDD